MAARDPGGWYCPDCGYVAAELTAGPVICPDCGARGLVSFQGAARPPLSDDARELRAGIDRRQHASWTR